MGIFNKIIDIKKKRCTNRVKARCLSCGENLKVNGKSIVNSNTILGDNVNFNGMTIQGNAKVKEMQYPMILQSYQKKLL